MKRLVSGGLALLLGTGVSAAWAQAAPTPVPAAASLAEAIARSYPLTVQGIEHPEDPQPLEDCKRLLAPWYDEALRSFRDFYVDPYPGMYSICAHQRLRGQPARASDADVQAWFAPWIAKVEALDPPDPLADIKLLFFQHDIAKRQGHDAEGLEAYLAALQQRLNRLHEAPTNTQLNNELGFITRHYFGAWQMQGEVQTVQKMYADTLGEGHRLSLSLLRTLAYHERFMGRTEAALASIERALALTQQHHPSDALLLAKMREEYAACLSNAGRLGEALAQMADVPQVFEAITPTPHASLTRIEYNLSSMALAASDYPAAIAHAERSIAHAQLSDDPNSLEEAKIPRANREVARMHLGDPEAPARLMGVIAETKGEMHIGPHAFELVEDAVARSDLATLTWAAKFIDQHLDRFRSPLQADTAMRPLMQAWLTAGTDLSSPTARPWLDQALAISLTGRSLGTLALTQFKLAQHLAPDEPDSAIWLYKRGANALQQLRTGLPGNEPELHRSWLGAYEADLRRFIGLLIDNGRLVEAEQALSALRDEESHEYSRRSLQPPPAPQQGLSYTPGEALRNQAMDVAALHAEAAAVAADARLDQRDSKTFGTLAGYVDPQAQADIAALSASVHQAVDEAPALARSLPGQALATDALPPKVARLTYFVRDDALDVVLQLGHTRSRKTVPVPRTQLNRTIQQARAVLGTPQMDALPPLQTLYRWLLAPVQAQLHKAGVKEIIWVPDAALRYVPFAALHDGRHYLAETYAVQTRWGGTLAAPAEVDASTAPAGQRTLARGHTRNPSLIAFGRTLGDATHSALPGVQDELAATRRAGAHTWLDAAFTAQSLRTALAQRPSTVHLASHFVLDPAGEEKSYLLLGDGRPLSLSALAAMPWQGVHLALLSACDSGVSFESAPGQAQVGFAATLHRAGVENVLATLWRISDGASADWFKLFYAHTVPAHLDARQVARTQKQWLHRYQGQPLGHPHYWAGFVWLSR